MNTGVVNIPSIKDRLGQSGIDTNGGCVVFFEDSTGFREARNVSGAVATLIAKQATKAAIVWNKNTLKVTSLGKVRETVLNLTGFHCFQ